MAAPDLRDWSGHVTALLPHPDEPPDWRAQAARWREIARRAAAYAAECAAQYQQRAVWIVPGDVLADLSPNRRLCRHVRALNGKAWRRRTRLLWIAAGRQRFRGPVEVRLIIRRGRAVDEDNAIAACKAVRDGLWGEDAMLPADDRRFIARYEVVQETGGRFRHRPEVEVCVTGEPE